MRKRVCGLGVPVVYITTMVKLWLLRLLTPNLESGFVTVIEVQGQDLLIGTTSGLYWYQQDKLNRVGLGTPLFGAYITSVLTLPDQQMLVATLDDGLFIKTAQGQWQQYDSSNGLPLDPVISLWYDRDSDYVWASSLKGVFRFKPAAGGDGRPPLSFELILSPYDRQLGTAPGRCCNGAGHSKVAKWLDQLWYPSLKGLVAVPLQLKMAPDRALQPLLQEVTGQKSYALLPDQRQLVLDMSDRNISISYSALEFIKANAIEFRYQLKGFDTEWQKVGQRREAIYTNLPPGQLSIYCSGPLQQSKLDRAAATHVWIWLFPDCLPRLWSIRDYGYC